MSAPAAPAADNPPARSTSRALRVALAFPSALGLVGVWGERAAGGWFPPLTLCAQLGAGFGFLALAAAVVALALRRPVAALAHAAGALLLLGPAYLHPSPAPGAAGARALRVLTANLGHLRSTGDDVARVLLLEDADVVFLQEVGPHHVSALEGLSATYPRRLLEPRGLTGIGVLSKLPLEDAELVLDDPERPAVSATLLLGGRRIALLDVHPNVSLGVLGRLSGDAERLLAQVRRATASGPALVCGDLNTTERSWIHRRLLAAGLSDAWDGAGRGFGFTFPLFGRWHGLPAPPFLRIDHIMCTQELRPLALRAGQDLGSDHLPLVCDLAWAEVP